MSDERIRLPWEDGYEPESEVPQDPTESVDHEPSGTGDAAPQTADGANTSAASGFTIALPPKTEGSDGVRGDDSGRGAPNAGVQPELSDLPAGEVAQDATALESEPLPGVAWSAGARGTGPGRRSGTSSRERGVRGRFLAALGVRAAEDVDDWSEREERTASIGGWLRDISTTAAGDDSVPEIGEMGAVDPELAEIAGEDTDESAAEVLSGPLSSVTVPRVAFWRLGLYGSVAVIVAIVLIGYGFAYPTVRGNNYAAELEQAFASTVPLREELPDLLGPELPAGLDAAASHYREIADTYPPYARTVALPPPRRPVIAFGTAYSRAVEIRSALLSLNELLGPAVDQVGSRAGYYSTLSTVQEQMAIGSAYLDGGDIEGDDVALVIEGTVGNATSLSAILAAQKPPAGFEELDAAIRTYLLEYVRLGRSYILALKTADPSAAGLRDALARHARTFQQVLTTPVAPAFSDDQLAALRNRESDAAVATSDM